MRDNSLCLAAMAPLGYYAISSLTRKFERGIGIIVLYIFVFAFSAAAVYIALRIARRYSVYDIPDGRRMHNELIPRLGGVGIFLGFAAGIAAALLFGELDAERYLTWRYIVFFCAAALVFATGFADDIKAVKARYKLAVQIAAGIAVSISGFRFTVISFAPLSLKLNLGLFSWLATIIWVAAIINAINMFDGLDGLAGTTSLIVFASYAVFFARSGSGAGFLLCTMMLPAIAGFLAFNLPFPKARIFMGDCGSNFLGFMLAVLPAIPNQSGLPSVPVWYAATLMILPIFDIIAAVWRRLRERRPVMSPDFSHLHHKLVKIGFSQRQTLVLIAVYQVVVAILVATAHRTGGVAALAILISIWTITILFFTVIHINRNGRVSR